jgi:hypothetical protein
VDNRPISQIFKESKGKFKVEEKVSEFEVVTKKRESVVDQEPTEEVVVEQYADEIEPGPGTGGVTAEGVRD